MVKLYSMTLGCLAAYRRLGVGMYYHYDNDPSYRDLYMCNMHVQFAMWIVVMFY